MYKKSEEEREDDWEKVTQNDNNNKYKATSNWIK